MTFYDSHHARHRSTVRRSMPRFSRNACTRSALSPWRMAEIPQQMQKVTLDLVVTDVIRSATVEPG